MKVIALLTFLGFRLNPYTVSARLNPKAIIYDSLKTSDALYKYKTRGTSIASISERQLGKRVSNGNSPTQRNRTGKVVKLEMQYCRPYPTIVQVSDPLKWGNFYLPSFVELHRCAGGCPLHPSVGYCAMTKEENVTILVTVHGRQIFNNQFQVVMSNHTDCSCACVPQKCHPGQRFNTNQCSCECTDVKDKDSCQSTDNMQWDKNQCRCVCSIRRTCNLGYKFSFNTCQCEPDEEEILARL
ncbi:vascular endothelial growth factor D-like [Pocillopora verrucosa]|uniref:vascular endothelial growth factor D-like n=1 Tax=Pocillopora verrucosa TaxID=203993 RepID=UPI0033418655